MYLFSSRRLILKQRDFYFLMVIAVITTLVFPRGILAASTSAPAIPTLIWPENQDNTILAKPVIRGLTENSTKVEVFIDGELDGMASVKNGEQGTASFAYTPFLSLKPGTHTITVRAWDSAKQVKSETSLIRTFIVEESYPTPILYQPVVNDSTVSTKPFIVGVAHNHSLIKVFIDGKLNGQFQLNNSNAETASFAYQPFLELDPREEHLVYVTASDSKGKESPYSNVIGFFVRTPQIVVSENPQVLGVSDIPSAQAQEEQEEVKETPSEETQGTSPEETGTTSETEQDASEAKNEDSSIIWWIILIIVIIIVAVNVRGRGKKDTSSGLKGLEKLGQKEIKSGGSPPSESNSEQQTLLQKDSKNNEGGQRNMPPPPPSK